MFSWLCSFHCFRTCAFVQGGFYITGFAVTSPKEDFLNYTLFRNVLSRKRCQPFFFGDMRCGVTQRPSGNLKWPYKIVFISYLGLSIVQ